MKQKLNDEKDDYKMRMMMSLIKVDQLKKNF